MFQAPLYDSAQNKYCTYTRIGTSDPHAHNTLQTMTEHMHLLRKMTTYKIVWITRNIRQNYGKNKYKIILLTQK